ncbi:MAG: hypothetical protein AB2L14_00090 [Candidatus Xenobiia bacterium LiM19]
MAKAIKTIVITLFFTIQVGIFSMASAATGTASCTFSLAISAINELSISGSTITLTIVDPGTPTDPAAASDSSTKFNITTNSVNTKIKAKLDTASPTGTTLTLSLQAPGTSTSNGDIDLTTTDQDVVTGIVRNASIDNVITYKFTTTPAAGVFTSVTRKVTLTISEL